VPSTPSFCRDRRARSSHHRQSSFRERAITLRFQLAPATALLLGRPYRQHLGETSKRDNTLRERTHGRDIPSSNHEFNPQILDDIHRRPEHQAGRRARRTRRNRQNRVH
jgi:hypothetical protein